MLGHTYREWDSFVLWAAETRSTRGNGENPNVVADLLQMGEGGKVGLDLLSPWDQWEQIRCNEKWTVGKETKN